VAAVGLTAAAAATRRLSEDRQASAEAATPRRTVRAGDPGHTSKF